MYVCIHFEKYIIYALLSPKRVHIIIPLFDDELHIEIRATYAKTT